MKAEPKVQHKPRSGEDPTTRFLVFMGTSPATGIIKWKGFIPKPDQLHEYSVCYRLEPDAYSPDPSRFQIARVCKVLRVRRAPLDHDAMKIVLRAGGGLGAADARDLYERLARLSGDLGSLLREFGGEGWFVAAERNLSYFRDWYSEELCPPYEEEALRNLDGETISRLARLAATEPWKLCFWWMTGAPLLDELDAARAASLAKKLGGDFPDTARLAVAAYVGSPFGDARSRGDSHVPFTWFKGDKAPPGLLLACLRHRVARVTRDPSDPPDAPSKVCCVGDAECERQVAEMIMRAVTAPEKPDAVRMRPRSRWWPPPGDARQPSEEQQMAIDALIHSRLGVVCGKPGTGKTSTVMRAVFSAFCRGVCVGAAFTGMAADNQRAVAGYGATAHRIIAECRKPPEENAFADRSVLFIDEGSSMSMRLARELLVGLGPKISRIYVSGDDHQMRPPGGGASFMGALIRRYGGTPLVSELKRSMRVSDVSGAFLRDLDRICEHRVNDRFEWSPDPASGHPFVFLRRGAGAAEDAAIIRAALDAAGIDPDSARAQIMVRTNHTRAQLARAWYELSPIGRAALAAGRHYDEREFSVGERVMFLRNSNHEYTPRYSAFKASRVMNGTCATITEIFDEEESAGAGDDRDSPPPPPPDQVTDTRARKRKPLMRRWIRAQPGDLTIPLDSYGRASVTRVPPVTIDKMQGLEADYSVVLLVKAIRKIGSRGMYTACSRGRLGCFVVADLDGSVDPLSGVCPSHDFADTVMASQGQEPRTDLWRQFPEYSDDLRAKLAVDPDACVYYSKKKKSKKKKNAAAE